MHDDEVLKEDRKKKKEEKKIAFKKRYACVDAILVLLIWGRVMHAHLEKGKYFGGKNHVFLQALFFILPILMRYSRRWYVTWITTRSDGDDLCKTLRYAWSFR